MSRSAVAIGYGLLATMLLVAASNAAESAPHRRVAARAPSSGMATHHAAHSRASQAAAAAAAAPRDTAAALVEAAGADSDLTLKGGTEGTVFRNLTIEGEDRIHVDFERPALDLGLDPTQAPGLTGAEARDELERTTPDWLAPLVSMTARDACPFLGRPWLSEFESGPVARFRPDLQGVERWKLTVVDAKGQSVTSFAGHGRPPAEITWDGRSQSGTPVVPGLTYSYAFEAYDRAGNKRSIVGQGFSVSAYHLDGADGPLLLFTARSLAANASPDPMAAPAPRDAGTPAILLEAASWINQSERLNRPIQVTATARSYEQANQLARTVTSALTPITLGGGATRLRPIAVVEPDAPEDGTVTIGFSR